MKKYSIMALTIFILTAIGIISIGRVEASAVKNGLVPIIKLPHPIVGLTRSSTTIGPATNNTLPSHVKDIIYQKYGEIRNVYRIGNDWILTTLGNHGSSGVIGLYHCSPIDTACLNGQTTLSFVGWSFFKPPFPGGATLLKITGNTLIIDNGGHQITFNVSTHSFGS